MRLALVIGIGFVLGLAVALAACSVPALSLEGKQCPCVEAGYVCDELTNRCLATNDGGVIIDSPSATQCLPAISETEIYRYTGMFDWQHEDASWMGNATEIQQASDNVQDSHAFKTAAELTAAKDYKIISSMRQIQPGSGTPAFGVALRAQLSTQDKQHYTCMWIPKLRELRIEVHAGNAMTLGSAIVPGTNALPTSFTMEASITGSTLACCIREISAARIASAVDPANTIMTGYPGLQTDRMQASFGSFVVLTPN